MLFAVIGFLFSCYRAPMMTKTHFDSIQLGMNIIEIEKEMGLPYEIRAIDDSTMEYVYIERIDFSTDHSDQRHYILTVSQGKVIEKKFVLYDSPVQIRYNYP